MSSNQIAHPESAAILAALPLHPRPGLYVAAEPDAKGSLTVLECAPDDGAGDAICGLAVRDEDAVEDGWYLGCITCRAEIEEADAGMCRLCREDATWQEQQRVPPEEDW
jgi:hypothetical protein